VIQQLGGAPPISDDGRWWWDGQAWQSLFSPDGRFKWDGQRWLAVDAPPAAFVPQLLPAEPAVVRPSWLDTGIMIPDEPGLRPVAASAPFSQAAAPAKFRVDFMGLLTDPKSGFVIIALLVLASVGGYKLFDRVTYITPVLVASDGKLVYAAGTIQKFALHQDMHGRLICGCGQPEDSYSSLDAVARETVNNVAPDGTATVTIKFESLTGAYDGQPVAFDLAKAKPVVVVISPDGHIVTGGSSGTAAGSATDSVPGGDQYSSILPGKDVKQGDSWGREFTRPNPVGSGTMHYVTNNTFLRFDQMNGHEAAVVQTAYFLPIDMLLDLHQLLALAGSDASMFPAGSAISYKGSEKGDMTTYVDTLTHQVALTQDSSDFDFQMSFQGLPNTPQFAPLQGVIHFAGRQNSTMTLIPS